MFLKFCFNFQQICQDRSSLGDSEGHSHVFRADMPGRDFISKAGNFKNNFIATSQCLELNALKINDSL